MDGLTTLNINNVLLKGPENSKTEKMAVVIDSITPVVDRHGLVQTCQLLHRLVKEGVLLLLSHSDLHEDHVNVAFEHLVKTVINLQPAPGIFDGRADIRHLRKSGKVLRSVSMIILYLINHMAKLPTYIFHC